DFFEHHHPLFYAYLMPIVKCAGEHASTVIVCRVAMWPWIIGILITTFMLSKRVFGEPTAWLALALLLTNKIILIKAIEIRPDVPMTLFGMIAIVLIYPNPMSRETQNNDPLGGKRWIAIGLMLALSLLSLQKAIFYCAAVGIIALWRIYAGREKWTSLGYLT